MSQNSHKFTQIPANIKRIPSPSSPIYTAVVNYLEGNNEHKFFETNTKFHRKFLRIIIGAANSSYSYSYWKYTCLHLRE